MNEFEIWWESTGINRHSSNYDAWREDYKLQQVAMMGWNAREDELQRFRNADELRKRAYGDLDCVLCGSRGCAHRERWDFGALWELTKRLRERVAELDNSNATLKECLYSLLPCGHFECYLFDHADADSGCMLCALDYRKQKLLESEQRDAAIRKLVGASELCQHVLPDTDAKCQWSLSVHSERGSHLFTPESTLTAVGRCVKERMTDEQIDAVLARFLMPNVRRAEIVKALKQARGTRSEP